MNRQINKGFTLIELVIVIAIISLISFVGAFMLTEAVRAYLQSEESATSTMQANLALERMSRELRTADAFSTINASSVTFDDQDGNTITYSLSGSNLMRNSSILADSISALTFTYFDSAGNSTAVLANVYYATINITYTQGSNSFLFRTTIHPRNMQ